MTAPGLLTGAEPTVEAYRDCADANDAENPRTKLVQHWYGHRDLDRLQFDGTYGSRY